MTARKNPGKRTPPGPKPMSVPKNLEQIEILAGFGLTDEEIAAVLGVCRKTLFKWRRQNKLLEEALRRGKAKADLVVVKSLYENAQRGDTVAQIFWLKNRQPGRWRDRHEQVLEGDSPIKILVIPAKYPEPEAGAKTEEKEEGEKKK